MIAVHGMKRPTCIAVMFALLLALAVPAAYADRLTPFSADYELYRGGSTLGVAQVSLEAQETAGCYTYSYIAKPAWMFRWATGSITESSQFCAPDGNLQPQHYRYHRSGIGADDENFSLDFDTEKHIVTDDKGVEREWEEGIVDRLLVQLEALRLVEGMGFPVEERRLTVRIVDDDEFKDYTLAVVGSETVKVPAGEFETIRVERINDPKKSTRFWVAPAYDNLIIKVEQKRKDSPAIGIALKVKPKPLPAATPQTTPPVADSPDKP